jgi:cobalt/nickel transport system permease protein
MHIPDGYLSPSTCAALWGTAAPFWYLALRRVRKALHTRMIPLLSIFAAFSFVVMMFNLPLPGGTTGHAVGMGIAAVVLGPWAAMIAISTALLIQALFFGDGGITAIGANCFNMAIAGSLIAWLVYRLASRGARIGSIRRVLGAGLAGYAAINVSALLAAIEFGVQPMLFHDASGAPLYAPYPLSISIPAMLLGHLTFAGLAEFVISSGTVAWLQRADPQLLRAAAPDAPDFDEPVRPRHDRSLWPSLRRMWIGIALLTVLTPLGIVAVGNAWGEWSPQDFISAEGRRQIAAASRNASAPAHLPRGLERLSALWTAPMSRYSPAFIRSASFGYLASAMVGVGLIICFGLVLQPLLGARGRPNAARRSRFVEKTLRGLLRAAERSLFADEMARRGGFLQRRDARVNVAALGALVVAAVAVRRVELLLALFVVSVLLAASSRVPLTFLFTRVWLPVFLFTGTIAAPALFLTPGAVIWRMPVLHWPVTEQGLRAAVILLSRAGVAASFAALLILCTRWTHLLRALRSFRIPSVVVVIVGMTWRYIFLFLRAAEDLFEARQARMVGSLRGPERRRIAAAAAGVLLNRGIQLSGEVHLAMQARGFRGEVRVLEDEGLPPAEWLLAGAFLAMAAAIIWLGR